MSNLTTCLISSFKHKVTLSNNAVLSGVCSHFCAAVKSDMCCDIWSDFGSDMCSAYQKPEHRALYHVVPGKSKPTAKQPNMSSKQNSSKS